MKGIEPLIGAALIIVISVSAIVIALQLSNQAVDRTRENLVFLDGKNNLILISNGVKDVVLEGNGSSRLVQINVIDGNYFVFPENDSISFVMQSKAQIIGVGVSKIEDEINITGLPNEIVSFVNYTNMDIQSELQFGRGSWNVLVKNFGWNPLTQKHIINITV